MFSFFPKLSLIGASPNKTEIGVVNSSVTPPESVKTKSNVYIPKAVPLVSVKTPVSEFNDKAGNFGFWFIIVKTKSFLFCSAVPTNPLTPAKVVTGSVRVLLDGAAIGDPPPTGTSVGDTFAKF